MRCAPLPLLKSTVEASLSSKQSIRHRFAFGFSSPSLVPSLHQRLALSPHSGKTPPWCFLPLRLFLFADVQQLRSLGVGTTSIPLSAASQKALLNIRTDLYAPLPEATSPSGESLPGGGGTRKVSAAAPSARITSKKQLRNIQGHIRRFQLIGGRPEFHNVDRNQHLRIFEPTDTFQVVITSSKNNCHVQLNNRGQDYRTLFGSFAGNVGIRKSARQSPQTAYRIGENIARKCKRLGVRYVHVKFRYLLKVEQCVKALEVHGVRVVSLTHEPRLPKCSPFTSKARHRRRV